MRLHELLENKNWFNNIIDSMILTIIDPKLPGARKSDCHTVCAYAIRNGQVPDDAEFVIYGHKNHPMHGVIIKDNKIIVDKFADSLVSYTGDTVKYDDWDETLNVVYRTSVVDLKQKVIQKYKEMLDSKKE
jgi:hypothetical protein